MSGVSGGWRARAVRGLPIVLMATATALLWGAWDVASAYRVFDGGPVRDVFRIAAVAASVALFVHLAGQLAGRAGLGWLLQHEPTRLQRGLVTATLAFVAVSVGLRALGADVTTLLASSAIASLVVGLSVQPMLASLVAGLTVQRQVRIGDGVRYDGKLARVVSLNWRTVTLARSDGIRVEVPNARLADGAMQVQPADRPMRCTLMVDMPVDWSPQRVRRVLAAVVEPLEGVDAGRALRAVPVRADDGSVGGLWRVAFWIDDFRGRSRIEGQAVCRLWNALRREGGADIAGWVTQAAAQVHAAWPAVREASIAVDVDPAGIGGGDVLPFDDGEPLVIPERLAGRRLLLVDGRLGRGDRGHGGGAAAGPVTLQAMAAHAERALARRVGPYAAHAVRREPLGGDDPVAWCERLARHVDDPADRAAFLREVSPARQPVAVAPRELATARDHTGRLIAEPGLHAVEHALVVALPASSGTGRD